VSSKVVLVVAADGRVWEFVHDVLAGDGHVVDRARDTAEATALLALRPYDLVLSHSRTGCEGLLPDGPDVIHVTVPITEGDLRAAVTARGR
jgi:DNA-binding NtrC family response regulator